MTVLSQTPPVVFVSGDGTGDFNTDGTHDQVEINQALDFVASHSDYTSVYLKGGNIYWIDEPIYISSNTILEGDSTAIIKLVNNANWETKFKSMIMQKGATFAIALEDTTNAVHDITIRGFEIDGNRSNQDEPSGHSYYNMIKLQSCYNITIHNMYMHDNLADIVNIKSGIYGYNVNFKMYNNRVHASGHDGVYIGECDNFEIYDNVFTNNRTDAHIRAQACNHFKVYNNICGNSPNATKTSGGIGVDVQVYGDTPLNDVEIYNNYIYGYGSFPGIWLWQLKKGGDLNTHRDVYIHHNIIENAQGAGIAIYGFNNTIIENNVIEHNGKGTNTAYTDNVLIGKQSGITFYKGGNKNKIKGYTTIVRNNIIGNNAAYGIENRKPHLHKFIIEYNCLYNNAKGNYKHTSSHTDIYVYPDYACDNPTEKDGRISYTYNILSQKWAEAEEQGNARGDLGGKEAKQVFHLQSETGRWEGSQWMSDDVTSFCINTGSPFSDYSNEPFPNGSRINIGAFGNTNEASQSDRIPDIHSFIVYPNPTTSSVTVSEEFIGSEYRLYNTAGLLLKSDTLIGNQIDLSDLANGVYLIKLKAYKLDCWRTGRVIKVD